MDILKPTSESISNPKQPNTGRRSFIWKAGSAVSAVLASAFAGLSKPRSDEAGALKEQVHRLSNQLGVLEDTNAIRKLHHTYGYYLDKGIHGEIVNLFADDGEVYFNGGIFEGKDKGRPPSVYRLFRPGFHRK